VEDLFHDVPQKYRFPELKLPKPLSEMEILSELYSLALKNSSTGCYATFLGAGAYNHFFQRHPYLAGRGEFRHRLHTLPTGGEPGDAASHFRVPIDGG